MFSIEYDPIDAQVLLLDQRLLPHEIKYYRYAGVSDVAKAITDMVVRGAPAIGITAGYALAALSKRSTGAGFFQAIERGADELVAARPTAVNLKWAAARMLETARLIQDEAHETRAARMQQEAEAIHLEDLHACKTMGKLGAEHVPDGGTVVTHCNTGALATGGYGTALGVIRAAHAMGKDFKVFCCETRPYLQGARLSAWELSEAGIDVEVITDSMAGHFLKRGEINFAVVGSDRIAANGDVANKIGTYGLAVLCRAHDVPFTVAAPWSTVDLETPNGEAIPIEERSSEEVATIFGKRIVAKGIVCRHPAFDVTPAKYVDYVFTERGSFRPAQGEGPSLFSRSLGLKSQ
ncbi:MAG: S-methyl-5-thioribose-1-phosphate isomerase [Myxococcales bacterium]|nr:MAG: S-methyl-5-thioribose-1-phosphate isomerase [Myxococcales bacterium]